MSSATILAPCSIEEAADAVRGLARERAVVVVTGGGTKRSWTRPAVRVDAEICTRALTGVVAYEPGDGVITALAGTPWRELEQLVARHGHHVSPSVPLAETATVGGVVAAGQSGLDRLRFGPVRDHVLGLRVVTADGSIAKSGGRLVKNVTGFDLQRLHTGAHGTLGLVAEVSLRLHAAPELRGVGLGFQPTLAAAITLARDVARASRMAWHVSVSNLGVRPGDSRWLVQVLVAGSAAGLESEVEALRRAHPELPWMLAQPGTDDETRVLGSWNALHMVECIDGSWPTLRATCAPSAVLRVCAVLDAITAERGIEARTTVQPGLGIVDAWIRDVDAPRVAVLSAALARVAARIHWRGLDDALRARTDLFGSATPVGLELMRRIRSNLDPEGLWACGRLAGGL